tara:strand:+ start:1548 stop:2486 length:939 start_codon:yes stop_codon:yes gene_type:complete
MKVFISLNQFCHFSDIPKKLLKKYSIEYINNPLKKKLSEKDLIKYQNKCDFILAGTEKISKKVMYNNKNLKAISRVGVGIDNIDLKVAKKKQIKVFNTPLAPSDSVAEFSLALILNSIKQINLMDTKIRKKKWIKLQGKMISDLNIGIIGTGNIGSKLIKLLFFFKPKKILAYDKIKKTNLIKNFNVSYVSKKALLENSDLISLHLSSNPETKKFIGGGEFKLMKKSAIIINTSRGDIIDEKKLENALKKKMIGFAALDAFEKEPYKGSMINLENCLITSHSSSFTKSARKMMEIHAVKNIIRFCIKNKKLN